MARVDLILSTPVATSTVGAPFPLGNNGALSPTMQAVARTGSGGGTVSAEVSNNGIHWISLGTITLTATANATSHITIPSTWAYCRANATTVGAGTVIDVYRAI